MNTQRFFIILLLMLNLLAFAAIQGWLGGGVPTGEPERITNQLNPDHIRLQGASATAETTTPADPAHTAEREVALPGPDEPASSDAASADLAANLAEGVPSAATPDTGELTQAANETSSPEAPIAEQSASAPPSPAPAAGTLPATAPPATVCYAWAGLSANDADRLTQRLRRLGVSASRSRSDTPDSWWVRIPPQASRAEAERRVQELRALGVTDTFIVPDAGPTQFAVSLGVFKTESRARVLLAQLRSRGVNNAGIEPRMSTTFRIQATVPQSEVRALEAGISGLAARRQRCA